MFAPFDQRFNGLKRNVSFVGTKRQRPRCVCVEDLSNGCLGIDIQHFQVHSISMNVAASDKLEASGVYLDH